MREFLTGLAIVLIVVLTTILVAPYFVDWNGQRGFLEARLSTALGQKVTIGGNIDLKLLPTPYLALDQVVVGGDEGPVRIGVHRLNLELSVAPLLHGEFDIVEARLREPTIRVTLEHDRSFPSLPAAPAFSADVRFDRIKVVNGTLAIADPESGRTFVYDHLDVDADAGSFAGPFKVFGAEGRSDHRTKFRLVTTALAKGQTHAKMVVEETRDHAGIDLDGNLDLRSETGGRVRQSFDGSLVLTGHLTQAEREPVGWRLSGPLKLDPSRAILEAGDLRLGSDEAGVTLQADARAELGGTPKLAIELKAGQLDIDRLSGAPIEADKRPPPPRLPDLATLRRMLTSAAPPIQTGLDLSVETATYGGETLSGIEAHLGLGDAARQPLKVSIDGPGGAHVAADGTLDVGAHGAFSGTVDLEADNLPRTVDWLASVAPSVPWKGADLAFKSVKLAGKVTAVPDGLTGTGLSLRLDRSRLAGAARLAMPAGSQAAKLTADLGAEALDVDGLPSLDALRTGTRALDLDLRLDAKTVKVSRFGDGELGAGHIRLAVAKAGERFELKWLRIDDLGGASIDASGHLDAQAGRFGITLDATRLDAAAGLVRQLVPGAVADALVARAAALAPAKLTFDLALASERGTLVPTTLSVAGTAAKTKVRAEVKPQDGATSVAAKLEAPEGSVLLRQLGIATVSIETVGASRVALSAHGRPNEAFDTKLTAAFGATSLDVDGRFKLPPSTIAGSGKLTLRSADLSPLVQAMAVAFPDLTGHLPADVTGMLSVDENAIGFDALKGRVSGVGVQGEVRWNRAPGDGPAVTGTLDSDRLALSSLFGLALGREQPPDGDAVWSRQPFAAGLVDPPRAAIKLRARSLGVLPGLDARKATLELGIGPGLVTLDKFAAEVLDGHVEGAATLRRDGRQATLEGRLALNDVFVHVPGTLDSRMTAHLDLAGSGTSAIGLVSSLAGSGEATATGLRVPNADPAAVRKVFDDVESDALAADPDATARAFEETAKTPLATEPRTFGLTLAAGDIHFVPKDQPTDLGQGVASKVAGSFDLGRFRIEERVEEALKILPKNWSGSPPTVAIALAGPVGKPARTIDMSGFSNALTARAVAREGARIEAGALDIRERSLFSTRLKFEQRRDEEREKVEEDARKAEAERKARLEAQRKERQRREKEKAERDEADKAREHRGEAPSQGGGPQPPNTPPPTPPPSGGDPSALGRY